MFATLSRMDEIVAYFTDYPNALESGATRIERKTTHISIVLLTEEFVYKFKRPVRYAFIDQAELADRRRNCQLEVELNSRLAPEVYIGWRAVFAVPGGNGFVLGEDGPGALDYCVVMRRLRDERNLSELLERDLIAAEDMTAVARKLGDFHLACRRGSEVVERRDFINFFEENVQVLESSGAVEASVLIRMRELLRRDVYALRRREVRGRIVDGHGDLRLDHIYLFPGGPGARNSRVNVIDCVEFNPGLRAVDPYEDLAFTTMALRFSGRTDLAARLIADYAAWTGDFSGLRLLPLFEIYRAAVRAKIDWFLFQQAEDQERRSYYQWRFFRYLDFIRRRVVTDPAPGKKISIVMGLPATGKSTFAERLRGHSAVPIISSDLVRKRMLGLAPHQVAGKEAFAGNYSPTRGDLVYRRMLALARQALAFGFDVILDGTFGKREHRAAAMQLARKTGAQLEYYEVQASPETVADRLADRRKRPGVSDLDDLEVWRQIAAGYEPLQPEELKHVELLHVHAPAAR